MPDYDKIGREVRAIFTAFPVEPETEEGRMVADLRYPGWRERGMPPAVPTPEAAERWGHLWWRQMGGTAEVVLVTNFAADDPVAPLGFYEPMSRTPRRVESDCFWAGPVLERPVRREG